MPLLFFVASAVLEVHGFWACSKIELRQRGTVRHDPSGDGGEDRHLRCADILGKHGHVCLGAPVQALGERRSFPGQRKTDNHAVAGSATGLIQTLVRGPRSRAACARRWERQRMDQLRGNPLLRSRKEPEGAKLDMSRIVRGNSSHRPTGHGPHRTTLARAQFGGGFLVPSFV